jgi:hypothetical protein
MICRALYNAPGSWQFGDITEGAIYDISIHQHLFGSKITVRVCHGWDKRTYHGSADYVSADYVRERTYPNLAEFTRDWTIQHAKEGELLHG